MKRPTKQRKYVVFSVLRLNFLQTKLSNPHAGLRPRSPAENCFGLIILNQKRWNETQQTIQQNITANAP